MNSSTAGNDYHVYSPFYGARHRYLTDAPYQRPDEEYVPALINVTVETFVVKFPEFSAILHDPARGTSHLESELEAARRETETGQWPIEIVEDSVYLLLAHRLQLAFNQAADTAVRGVAAAKGDRGTAAKAGEYDPSSLSSTVYGSRLESLRTVAQFGGIVI